MTTTNGRLGTAERQVLEAVDYVGGTWTKDKGVLYENFYWTRCILARLANRGLVKEVRREEEYTLTVEGRGLLDGTPVLLPRQQKRR